MTNMAYGNKIVHDFKIGFDFGKHFINQTYSLIAFNDELIKVVLLKKYRFLRSTTQGSIRRDSKKKKNHPWRPPFKKAEKGKNKSIFTKNITPRPRAYPDGS